jgi:hypothetical protein
MATERQLLRGNYDQYQTVKQDVEDNRLVYENYLSEQENIANASLGEKLGSAYRIAQDNFLFWGLGKFFDGSSFALKTYKQEEGYMPPSFEAARELSIDFFNDINYDFINELMASKSNEQYSDINVKYLIPHIRNQRYANTLSQREKIASFIVPALTEPDIVFSVGAGIKIKKAIDLFGGAGKLAATSAAISGVTPFARDFVTGQDREVDDLMAEGLLFGAIEGSLLWGAGSRVEKAFLQSADRIPTTEGNQIANNIVQPERNISPIVSRVDNPSETFSRTDNLVDEAEETQKLGAPTDTPIIGSPNIQTRADVPLIGMESEAQAILRQSDEIKANSYYNTYLDMMTNPKTGKFFTAKERDKSHGWFDITTDTGDRIYTVRVAGQRMLQSEFGASSRVLDRFVKGKPTQKDIDIISNDLKNFEGNPSFSSYSIPDSFPVSLMDRIDKIIIKRLARTAGKLDNFQSLDNFFAELHTYDLFTNRLKGLFDNLAIYIAKNRAFNPEQYQAVIAQMGSVVDEVVDNIALIGRYSKEELETIRRNLKGDLDLWLENASEGGDILFGLRANKDPQELLKIAKGADKTKLRNILKILNTSKDEAAKNKALKELDKLKSKILSSYDSKTGIRLKADGDFFKIGNKKIPAAIALGILAPSAAMADDGSGDMIVEVAIGTLVALFLGAQGLKLVKSGRLGEVLNNNFTGAADEASRVSFATKAKRIYTNIFKGELSSARTRFTETFTPIMQTLVKEGNLKAKVMLENILFNGFKGNQKTAEVIKSINFNRRLAEYTDIERPAYAEWLKANGITAGQRISERLQGHAYLQQFRNYVTDAKEGLLKNIPENGKEAIIKVANEQKRIEKELVKEAEELGVEEAGAIKMFENYVTRKYTSNGRRMFAELTWDNREKLIYAFAQMAKSHAIKMQAKTKEFRELGLDILKRDDLTIAEIRNFLKQHEGIRNIIREDHKLLSAFDEALNKTTKETLDEASNKAIAEEARDALKKFFKLSDESTADEVVRGKVKGYINALSKNMYSYEAADIFSSFKSRIGLDMSAWEDFTIKINGVEKKITKETIFNRNSFDLFESYANSLTGRNALKFAGYQVSDVKNIIKTVKNETARKELNAVLDIMIGRPVIDITEPMRKSLQTINNLSSGVLLIGSSFSVIMEASWFLGRSIFSPRSGVAGISGVIKYFSGMGEDAFALRAFIDGMGLGSTSKIGKANLRGIEVDVFGDDFGGTLYNLTKEFRDFVITSKPFSIGFISDMNEIGNLGANFQKLTDFVYGKGKIADDLLEKYGIKEGDEVWLKKYLSHNSKGYGKYPDWSKIPYEDAQKIKAILFNMNQYGAQRVMHGTTPAFAYMTALGSTISKLLTYPLNAFGNIGLPALKLMAKGDMETWVGQASYFLGAIAAMKLKDLTLGRSDRDEEDYYMYAMLNMPLFGGVGAVIDMFKGGVTPNAMKDIQDTVSFGFSQELY